MQEMASKYNPKEIEDRIYQDWENKKYFMADNRSKKPPFTVMIPPPNVTSVLHMGHGLNNAIQDVIIRFKRMSGFNALWVPGTDHAGIATQNVVEKMLAKEGKKRQDLGREKFLEQVWAWKDKYGHAIINQLKKIGSSCDWSRTRFTMDEGLSKSVRAAFVKLYADGLIYQGEYIINWCPRCTTALSDEEVEHKGESGHIYHLKYLIKGSDDFLTIATVRPETLLGDTAVAVHPDDARYQQYIGKTVILPIVGRELPIIADSYVDREFGTGVLKVTPAHDHNDFELGMKHSLPIINVLTPEGIMNANAGKYQGLGRFECRKQILKDLREKELLIKEESYHKNVGRCYRCDDVVEPYVSKQWFVRMAKLAKPALEAVEKGEVELAPEQWKKVYINWMTNIRDWCISRQIWWGHRIPAWHCKDCNAIIVKQEDPTSCDKCGSQNITQDTDVLDTWFSSWLWPLSTLGWPEKTEDLKVFYPTQFLSTAPEILFFWVARMVMAGLYFENKIPFSKVYLHSTVCDLQGKKMSKSLGNGIDPLEIVEEFGADSLRFTILYLSPIGQRIRLAKTSFEIGFKFANKLWNASRFILMNLGAIKIKPLKDITLNDWDYWIIEEFNKTISQIRADMETFRFDSMTNEIYHFIWSKFCDWYLEVSKTRIYSQNETEKSNCMSILLILLEKILRLLHPIMPFITEEIWGTLPNKTGDTIMNSPYPEKIQVSDSQAAGKIYALQEIIYLIRNIRGELGITPDKKVQLLISAQKEKEIIFQTYSDQILSLAKVEKIDFQQVTTKPEKTISAVGTGYQAYVFLEGILDFDKEKERLEKEVKKLEKDFEQTSTKLSNPEYVNKAPATVVEKEREKADELKAKLDKLQDLLKNL
jgi:valyl-tRNA synthetase